MPLYYLCDRLSNAGIRLLDMQFLTHRGGDVCDMHLAAGAAVFHLPAIEQQGDMRIIGIPLAMRRACRRRPSAKIVEARLQHKDDVA